MDINEWNADSYHKHADFVSNLAFSVIDLLNPQENEMILDLGCGDGTLSWLIISPRYRVCLY
ncbi:MAG: hypothetical protein RBR33_04485 [Sulfurovaceae bacterium]|nr:hypothetical protein [Sulfurovaceae bacterium]